MVKSKVTHLNLFAHNQLFVCWRDYWTTSERQRGYHYATHWNGLRPQPRSVQTSVEECSEATAGLNGERERESKAPKKRESSQWPHSNQLTKTAAASYMNKNPSPSSSSVSTATLFWLSPLLFIFIQSFAATFSEREEKRKKKNHLDPQFRPRSFRFRRTCVHPSSHLIFPAHGRL